MPAEQFSFANCFSSTFERGIITLPSTAVQNATKYKICSMLQQQHACQEASAAKVVML